MFRAGSRLLLTALLAAAGVTLGTQPTVDEAAAAFQQGDAAGAERKLATILNEHPTDPAALTLMGVVLDSLQRYKEAELFYQRALKVAPSSAPVLNNAANHYLASGDRGRARELYLKTVEQDPRHPNANLQLAQMSVESKRGPEALGYLNHLEAAAKSDPGALLLRARALAVSERCSEANSILGELDRRPEADPRWFFSLGVAHGECKEYEAAEKLFARALETNPADFDILYNLGYAALRAGHSDRAAAVLTVALKDRPEDPDCLYALAQALLQQKRPVDAAALLARGERLAPGRADMVLLLAQVSAQLEFYEDAATAYDAYLKLKPADDIARRERAFALTRANQSNSALEELVSFTRKHPRDATGFYELGIAQLSVSRAKALESLNHALELDPALVQVRYTRALVNLEDQRPAAAVDDLRAFLTQEPENFRAVAHLGQAYLALNRVAEAGEVLRKAASMAPDNRLVLVQYHRVLARLGRRQEAADVLARLRQASGEETGRRVGLLDYFNLPAAGQRARYIENLRRNSAADPGDVRLKLRLARELFADGKSAEGLAVLAEAKSAAPSATVLAECGRILLDHELYDAARDYLNAALETSPNLSSARLDLAIVLFHSGDAGGALAALDQTPEADRKGDYYVLRAQLLDAQGKLPEAAEALNRGIRMAPTRADLYLQASGFLMKHKLYKQAEQLLEQADRVLPDNRDLLLARAVAFAVMPRDEEAEKLLAAIQARWPEWDRPYLLSGILLEIQLKSEAARPLLETAIALGSNTPEAYYYLALAITHTDPNDVEGAAKAISRALALTSKDPWIWLLAGKIALARKDYGKAAEQLANATTLLPTLVPAHYALHDAYKALGNDRKAAGELEAIQRIADENAASDKSPFPVEDFVFTVRPPA